MAIAAVISCVALIVAVQNLWGGGSDQQLAFYYDLNTGELFADSASLIAPIPAPSGPLAGSDEPAGVRAYVFTCGEVAERYIAWLEKAGQDAAHVSPKRTHPVLLEKQAGGVSNTAWVALPSAVAGEPIEWVPADSPDGIDIVRSAVRACPDGFPARPVNPLGSDSSRTE